MQPINPADILAAASSQCQSITLILYVIFGLLAGVLLLRIVIKGIKLMYPHDYPQAEEKPKRHESPIETFDDTPRMSDLWEKPKHRLVGDDGELFHPIEEYFESHVNGQEE